MSSAATATKPNTPFLWVFGAFTCFAILLAFLLNLADPASVDPKESERLANKEEIAKVQAEIMNKLGMTEPSKREELITKSIQFLSSRKPAPSSQVVPGSPTQLKQTTAPTASVDSSTAVPGKN